MVLRYALFGLGAGWVVWTVTRSWFEHPLFIRSNYRGVPVPTATGIVLALAVVVVEGFTALDGEPPDRGRLATVLVVMGFCLLGAVDDLAGSGDDRGFRGHLRALRQGRVTTGLAKLIVGALLALVAVAVLDPASGWRLVADAALIALCANLANLLDRAPGRVTKVAVVSFAVLVLATRADPGLAGPAIVVGAAAALLVPDLRERLMLGDAGANPLGAALGLGLVLATPPVARNLALAVVVLLNAAGELVSFSRVIDAVPPLRAVDRLGRPASGRSSG